MFRSRPAAAFNSSHLNATCGSLRGNQLARGSLDFLLRVLCADNLRRFHIPDGHRLPTARDPKQGRSRGPRDKPYPILTIFCFGLPNGASISPQIISEPSRFIQNQQSISSMQLILLTILAGQVFDVQRTIAACVPLYFAAFCL